MINRDTQRKSELTRIPVDFLERIGTVNERELPPIEKPTDEPYPIDPELFEEDANAN
jgi:hypothetical protein